MICRISSATKVRNRTTYSALPVNRLRRSLSCVAIPAGQVPRWHLRISRQPSETKAAVPNPNRSAPKSAPITTSRPVFSLPVDLHEDPVAQPVEDQRLLRFGQAEFPGRRRRA